jgi:hypothetical protein
MDKSLVMKAQLPGVVYERRLDAATMIQDLDAQGKNKRKKPGLL